MTQNFAAVFLFDYLEGFGGFARHGRCRLSFDATVHGRCYW